MRQTLRVWPASAAAATKRPSGETTVANVAPVPVSWALPTSLRVSSEKTRAEAALAATTCLPPS